MQAEEVTSLVTSVSAHIEGLTSACVNDMYSFNNALGERVTAAETEYSRYIDRLKELQESQRVNRRMVAEPPRVAVELNRECARLEAEQRTQEEQLAKELARTDELRAEVTKLREAQIQRRLAQAPRRTDLEQQLSAYEKSLGMTLLRVRNEDGDNDEIPAGGYLLLSFAGNLGEIGLRLTPDGQLSIYADRLPRSKLAPLETEFMLNKSLAVLLCQLRRELQLSQG